MKIDPKELYSISFYEYGEAYYGSCGGMRYRVAREPLRNVHYTPPDQRDPAVLKAVVWPEPMSYAAADPKTMKSAQFEFSAEGLSETVRWLNEQIDKEQIDKEQIDKDQIDKEQIDKEQIDKEQTGSKQIAPGDD